MHSEDLARRIEEARRAWEAIPASRENGPAKRAALERYLALRDGPAQPKPTLPRPIGFKH